jgi:hypothetical protein
VTSAPSPSATFQARLAIALIVGLIVLGIVCYGLSREDLNRVWKQILARPGGPMTFRFILQPAMAAIDGNAWLTTQLPEPVSAGQIPC